LLQQAVDERRLAVVDMGDDGDIAEFHCGVWLSGRRVLTGAAGRARLHLGAKVTGIRRRAGESPLLRSICAVQYTRIVTKGRDRRFTQQFSFWRLAVF
jgi:hypothetical protein